MSGPEAATQNWNTWAHGTDAIGAVGILSIGRALPTDSEVAGVSENEGSFSVYRRAYDKPQWLQGLNEFVATLRLSTKNSCGIIFRGHLACSHIKSKSASTAHETHLSRFNPLVHSASSDKRWAIRTFASRIDYIWLVSNLELADYSSAQILPKRQKMLGDDPNLATEDQNWDRWAPTASVHPKEELKDSADTGPAQILEAHPRILLKLKQQTELLVPDSPRPKASGKVVSP